MLNPDPASHDKDHIGKCCAETIPNETYIISLEIKKGFTKFLYLGGEFGMKMS